MPPKSHVSGVSAAPLSGISVAPPSAGTLAPSSVYAPSGAAETASYVSGVSAVSGPPTSELSLMPSPVVKTEYVSMPPPFNVKAEPLPAFTGPQSGMPLLPVPQRESRRGRQVRGARSDVASSVSGAGVPVSVSGAATRSNASELGAESQMSYTQPEYIAEASGRLTGADSEQGSYVGGSAVGGSAHPLAGHDDDQSSVASAAGAEPVFADMMDVVGGYGATAAQELAAGATEITRDGDAVSSNKSSGVRSFRRMPADLHKQRRGRGTQEQPLMRNSIHGSQFLASQAMDDDVRSVYSAADTEIGNVLTDLRVPDDKEVSLPEKRRRAQRATVNIKESDREKALASAMRRKFAGAPTDRIEDEKARTKRQEKGRLLMHSVLNQISTTTSFATATQHTPRYPRLVKPLPDLASLVNYRPTQLELDWNKSMLGRVDWLSVGDIDLVNPEAYGSEPVVKPQLDNRDLAMLEDSVPYDLSDSREAWKGRGRVPIFTVRPAYTEIGLRDTHRTTALAEADRALLEKRKIREVKETEQKKKERFHSGIKETFEVAERIDSQWLTILIQVGTCLGLVFKKGDDFLVRIAKDDELKERFILLRQQTLVMARHCTDAGIAALDDTFLSVLPNSSREDIEANIVLPEVRPAAKSGQTTAAERAEWKEAWVMWAELYVSEMREMGLTTEGRAKKFRQTRPKIVQVLKLIHAATFQQTRSELRHPENQRATLVAVKEVLVEDEAISQGRDLIVSHFDSRDPLPVDRLVPSDKDFYELPNTEQLEVRRSAPEELYEGGMVLWRRNLADEITAEYVLPRKDAVSQEKTAALKDKELIDASWNQPRTATGAPCAVEYDSISTFRGRLIHQRESHFVFREGSTKVKVAYPPRRLVLSYAPGALVAGREARELTRLREDSNVLNQKNTKHIFNWEGDLVDWTQTEADTGRQAELEAELQARRRKRRAEYEARSGKRRKFNDMVQQQLAEDAAQAAAAAAAGTQADGDVPMATQESEVDADPIGDALAHAEAEPAATQDGEVDADPIGDALAAAGEDAPSQDTAAPDVDLVGDALRAAGDASQGASQSQPPSQDFGLEDEDA